MRYYTKHENEYNNLQFYFQHAAYHEFRGARDKQLSKYQDLSKLLGEQIALQTKALQNKEKELLTNFPLYQLLLELQNFQDLVKLKEITSTISKSQLNSEQLNQYFVSYLKQRRLNRVQLHSAQLQIIVAF